MSVDGWVVVVVMGWCGGVGSGSGVMVEHEFSVSFVRPNPEVSRSGKVRERKGKRPKARWDGLFQKGGIDFDRAFL